MRKHSAYRWGTRAVAAALVPAMVAVGIPAQAASVASSTPPPPAPRVQVNRAQPRTEAPAAFPSFSATPTALEIRAARVFGEPILPLGEPSSGGADTTDLAAAISTWLQAGDPEATGPFEQFLLAHPSSVWRASVLANLGVTYERLGYFTRADAKLSGAWTLSREATDLLGRSIAEQAITGLADLYMQFGDVASMRRLLEEVGGREVMGVAAGRLERVKNSIWILENMHQTAVPSGPVAFERILSYVRPGEPRHPAIAAFHATEEGASIAEMAELSRVVDFPMDVAYRDLALDEVPIPSIAHIRPGHFTAIVGENANHYILDDPGLGGEFWISRAALREQASGYFLVPEGERPSGWKARGPDALQTVRGRCYAVEPMPGEPCPPGGCCGGTGGSCPGGSGGAKPPPMAAYSLNPIHASVMITDTPVGYAPPRGPAVPFEVRYHQRGSTQPITPTYGNMGSRWFPVWTAYIEDNPANLMAPANLVGFGGGLLVFSGFSGDRYAPDALNRSELVRISSSPIQYERRLTDGSREVYAVSDGAATFPRRVFLTELYDPQGQRVQLSYDPQLRLTALTDAIGQVTTLAYEHPDDALRITKVTDPFGRSAKFDYDGQMRMDRITDVIGIESELHYGAGAFISELRTPYGTTVFQSSIYTDQVGHPMLYWAEATDPVGAKERIELNIDTTPTIPHTAPLAVVPVGFQTENANLGAWNSFYWDKRAMALHPNDRTKAHLMKWAMLSIYKLAAHMVTEKRALENRVWYSYEGSPAVGWVGGSRWPTKVARVLDDGTSQIHRFEWTDKGKLRRYIDPAGRETVFEYGGAGIDLLRVMQRNGFANDLLAELAHNGIHLPLTVTDASGQTTTLTYNTAGQPLTVTNAKNETTTLTYDTAGYLQTITGPVAGSTVTLTWDGFGRARTVAYDGRTVTFSYDAIDRVTRVDYPDGTYEEVTYKLLDPETYRDRQGRVSRLFHDTLQRLVAFQDPQGRLVKQTWCECGDLEKLIDAAGNETTWFRDLQGRVTQQLRANGSSSSVTYETTTSRVKKVTDAKLQDVLYEYFLDDSLKRVSFANAANPPAPVNFTYDASYPRVLTKTDGQGLTTYGYNAVGAPPALGAGQLASIDGPLTNDTITLGYDQLGRVVSRAINGVAESVAFDTLGRLQSVTNPLGTFNYSYVGTTERLQTLAYPNGQSTELSYHPANQDHRLQQILHKKPGGALLSRHAYTYEPSGNIKTWTQETDVAAAKVYDFEYDRADQLTAATLKTTDPTPTVLKRYVYAYDPAGNRTSEQIDNGVTSALHNNMNQTTSTQPGGMLRVAGTTNEAANVTIAGQPARILDGNRFEGETPVGSGTTSVPVVSTDGSGNARTYTYNVSVSGSTKTLTYDPNGNLLSDGLRTYTWDALDQLIAIDQGTHRSEFTYDSVGRRVRIVEKEGGATVEDRRFVWHGTLLAEERDASGGTIKRYVSGGVQQGGANYFLAGDHLSSARELTDVTGAARARYDFDAYGKRAKTAGDLDTDLGFAGMVSHATSGMELAVYRGYDPMLGRWVSADPVGLAGGINLYQYSSNNPGNAKDPLGLCSSLGGNALALLAGIVVGAATTLVVATLLAWAFPVGIPVAIQAGLVVGGLVATILGGMTAYYWFKAGCAQNGFFVLGNMLGAGLMGGILKWTGVPRLPWSPPRSTVVPTLSPGTNPPPGGGLSPAGHALTKHPSLAPQILGQPAKGSPSTLNQLAQQILQNILANGQIKVWTHPRFGQIVEFRLPSGQGARFNSNGEFIGFLDPLL